MSRNKMPLNSRNVAANFFFWDCPNCTFQNSNVLTECELCGCGQERDSKVGTGTLPVDGGEAAVKGTSWNCVSCTFQNTHYGDRFVMDNLNCEMCGQLSPLSAIISEGVDENTSAPALDTAAADIRYLFEKTDRRSMNCSRSTTTNKKLTSRDAFHFDQGSRREGGTGPGVVSGPVPSRAGIGIGAGVYVVQKHHQPTGQLTFGIVRRHLTSSAHHPRGIKVELETGEVGRVQSLAHK